MRPGAGGKGLCLPHVGVRVGPSDNPHTPLPLTPLPLHELVALQPRRQTKRKVGAAESASTGNALSAGSLAAHNRTASSASSASSSSASSGSATASGSASGSTLNVALQMGAPSRRGFAPLLVVPGTGRHAGGKRARSLVDDGESAGMSSDDDGSSFGGDAAREEEWDEADALVLQSVSLLRARRATTPCG